MPELIDFCATDRQRAVIGLLGTHSYSAIAAKLGIHRGNVGRAVQRVKSEATRRGWSPEHDMTRTCPPTHYVKGTSTLYKGEEQLLQWVKTNADWDRLVEAAKEMAAEVCQDVEPLGVIKPPKRKQLDPDRLAVYPIGDAHVGLYCWHEDAEADWDCGLAESTMRDCFSKLLAGTPDTESAVLVNLGDWFHTDTLENETRRSGHKLDVDSRWPRVVQVGVRLIRTMIDSLLRKHANVRVINEIGNHDDQTAIVLSMILAAAYERNDRVSIDLSPDVFHWVEWNNVLIGVHHGHKCKPVDLYRVMAEDQREACGRCQHRHWLTGHIHHERSVDIGGQKIESFRSLIPRDTHSHSSGYRSQRSISSITYHKEFGEDSRKVIHVSQSGGA